MTIHFEAFDQFEFADRTGKIRTIAGCSTVGIFEFLDRISLLTIALAAAEDTQTWQQLYLSDATFAHNIQRILELNGINPDWVSLAQVGLFLFPHQTPQGWQEGLLIQINAPTEVPKGGTVATLGEIVGAIATHTTLDKAIELAETVPVKQMQAIIKGKNALELRSTEEGKKKDQQKRDRAKAKEQLDAMRAAS